MNDIIISFSSDNFLQVMLFAVFGFAAGMLLTPLYTTLAYKYEWWKVARTKAVTGETASVYQKLHGAKHKRNIPTMAGVIFVLATALVTVAGNFDRSQTWLPLAAMLGAGTVGLIDDVFNIRNFGGGIAGLQARSKSILVFIVSLIGGWWFYEKLGVQDITVPFVGIVELGWLIVPLFVLVLISTANAVNISDGLDGLAGGLAVIAFATFGFIALMQGETGVAAFCTTMVGSLLSYTWFNIHPARFFMGDSGSFAIGAALAVVAMLTDTVLLLPIIGAVFVVEAASSIIQISSKKYLGRKIFKIAPIHHHFEASGWPETKVTMRFWLLALISSALGVILYLMEYVGVS